MRLPPAIPALLLALATACAGGAPRSALDAGSGERERAARAAQAMVGSPYRYGGATPRGFDCSGLVVYSYTRAGVRGLPHSAQALERRSRPIALDALEPGDLLFFHLGGAKARHVAIYVGDERFVHAPSGGKRVETVRFDNVYWGPRLKRAGRLE